MHTHFDTNTPPPPFIQASYLYETYHTSCCIHCKHNMPHQTSDIRHQILYTVLPPTTHTPTMCYWFFQLLNCMSITPMAVPRHELTRTIVHRYPDTAYRWDQPISPYNHRNNATWVLICGDVHPNLGQRRIHRLNNHGRALRRPCVPVQDIEAYTKHLVTNAQRDLQSLHQTTQHKDTDRKLATWNLQGAQVRLSLQRWADILYLVSDRRIDVCGL